MPTEPFFRGVRGGSGTPISTSTTGVIETNNYTQGTGIDVDGTAYPYTFNPSWDVQFIHVTEAGSIDVEVTTTDGDTFQYPLAGGTGVIDWWEVDSVTFRDPNGTAASLKAALGGD